MRKKMGAVIGVFLLFFSLISVTCQAVSMDSDVGFVYTEEKEHQSLFPIPEKDKDKGEPIPPKDLPKTNIISSPMKTLTTLPQTGEELFEFLFWIGIVLILFSGTYLGVRRRRRGVRS